MNIQAEKLETNDPVILSSIKKLFNNKAQTDFWNTLSSDQKEEIQPGINEIEQEETVDYEDFMKKHWK